MISVPYVSLDDDQIKMTNCVGSSMKHSCIDIQVVGYKIKIEGS